MCEVVFVYIYPFCVLIHCPFTLLHNNFHSLFEKELFEMLTFHFQTNWTGYFSLAHIAIFLMFLLLFMCYSKYEHSLLPTKALKAFFFFFNNFQLF